MRHFRSSGIDRLAALTHAIRRLFVRSVSLTPALPREPKSHCAAREHAQPLCWADESATQDQRCREESTHERYAQRNTRFAEPLDASSPIRERKKQSKH